MIIMTQHFIKLLFLSSLNKIGILLLIASVFLSCNTPEIAVNKYDTIQGILQDSLKVKPYDKLLVLTETGCLGCNKSFAYLIEGMLNSDALVVVTATGTSVDISEFSEDKYDNVIYDYKNYFKRNNILENSGAIFLSENNVDTIISIEAKGIEEQLRYIQNNVLDN